MMWAEKHRPVSLEAMVGNEDARTIVYDWLMNWKLGMKPLLLVGPPGVGKTTMAYAAARQQGFVLLELNASDTRTKAELSKRLQSVVSASLMAENRMLLLDEVDGLYGRADYGGLEYLVDHLEDLPVPAILTANDPDSEQVKKLAKKARLVRMFRIPSRLAELYLRRVLDAEGKTLDDEQIRNLVNAAAGDMRTLLNTAQVVAESGSRQVSEKEVTYTLSQAVSLASSSADFEEALSYMQNCDADPDEKLSACFNAVVSSRMDEESRRKALRYLAEANLLLKRLKSTQQWRQLRYFDRLLVASILGSKVSFSQSSDTLPFPLKLRIWNDSKQLKSFVSMLSKQLHVSTSEISANLLSYFLIIISKSEDGLKGWALRQNLSQPELNVLEKELKSVISALNR
ncbi:MAG: AAA family ATPase [Conexivisphaerales archaeon]